MTALHSNSQDLKDLFNNEFENTRNIGGAIGSLKNCIGELEGINDDLDAQTRNYDQNEEEKI